MSTDEENDAFHLILSLAERVTSFSFEQSVVIETGQLPVIHLPSSSVMYSSLTKLNVDVESFGECLAILDGRFESLSDCSIYIGSIGKCSADLNHRVSVVVSLARS